MSLTVIFGSMYSGKTTELIRRINRFQSINKRVLIINNRLDDRYSGDDAIVSHDEYKFNCVKCKKLHEIDSQMRIDADVDVVAIDEGQFFPDLKKYALKFVEQYGKDVIVAGLIGDYERKKFGSIIDLFNYSDNIVHLKSLCTNCKDGTVGIFTKKICTKRIVLEMLSDRIDVGSKEKYIALCRKCYLDEGTGSD